MPELSQLLTTSALRLVESVIQIKNESKHTFLGINHWLSVILERYSPMVSSMIAGVDVVDLRKKNAEQLSRGELGLALDEQKVSIEAEQRARSRGKMQAAERDVAAIVLQSAGIQLVASEIIKAGETAGETVPQKSPSPVVEPGNSFKPTPTLDQFGRDLTKAARDGKLPPMIGRENEVQLVIETLLRRTKRNPVLVGPAGVGKTAIVEGLAQKVAEGKVESIPPNTRIVGLQPSTIVAGAKMSGDLEQRMQNIVKEASQDGIILFIDEIHTIMGAGGMAGTTDMASILKPSLARGELACIAATTDNEYRRFIEMDTALERRFQPIRVNELSPEETFEVLKIVKEVLVKRRPIEVDDGVLKWLINFGHEFMRNRYFPDKAVDLLEQCVAHALADKKKAVELTDAEEVARRMIGMPLEMGERISNLEKQIKELGLLSKEETSSLLTRLNVTLRGLDLKSSRPNAVILLSQEAARESELMAKTIAKSIYGDEDRVITIDFSRFWQPEDINLLVGSPPGYVGYSESLPIHRLIQIPWCVLRFENVDHCHPNIRDVIAQAISDGWIMDGRGKSIFLSDAVVILTARLEMDTHRSIGFQPVEQEMNEENLLKEITKTIGPKLQSQLDMVILGIKNSVGISEDWLKEHLLEEVNQKYKKQGLNLEWDSSLIHWLLQQQDKGFNEQDWERWVDQTLSPAIIPYLPHPGRAETQDLCIRMEGDQIQISIIEKGDA